MMINVRRSLFWATLYLGIMFILAQADYFDRPIINFANYFYLIVMIAIPVTLFFPSIAKAPMYVPLLFWGAVYLVLLQVLSRESAEETGSFAVIILEFLLLQLGVWLTYRLAKQMQNAETLIDALAVGAYPSRAMDIDLEYPRIKIEFARCRRYNRPLSLIVLSAATEEEKISRKLFGSLQQDLSHHFKSARLGQILDEHIRQTDLIMKEKRGGYVILCPETARDTAALLAQRLSQTIREKTDFSIRWGVAAFPSDVLTFDDLLQQARKEMQTSPDTEPQQEEALPEKS